MGVPANSGTVDDGNKTEVDKKTGDGAPVDGVPAGGGDAGKPQGGLSEASNEELLAEIKKLRAENAAKRVDAKKAKTELQQFEEWKRSQMSDAERLKHDLESAKKAAVDAYAEVYADKYNVPPERRKFVAGGTKEEIEEACKALGEEKPDSGSGEGQKPKAAANLFPGTRGAPVGSKAVGDADALLRQKLMGR
jgi:hypothetical protein